MPTVGDCLKTHTELRDVSASPRLDVEILLAHVLKKDRGWLFTWPEKPVSADQYFQFLQLVNRRIMGEPVAYLVGSRGFWTLELEVNASVLVPRPETELLVELALQNLSSRDSGRVLDMGTGSGAIALAIAREKPQAKVLAVDKSSEALALAKRNADKNGIANVEFVESDWFTDIPTQKFDLIVSNPPYIAPGDPHLEQGDLAREPQSALVAEDKGYADLRYLINEAGTWLQAGAYLLLEHGWKQGKDVREMFRENAYSNIETVRDFAGNERVSLGRAC